MKTFFKAIGVLSLASLLPLRSAEPEAPDADRSILLPETTVFGKMKLRPEEQWLTGTLGNFEIFSYASERETRKFVSEFYKFHQAFTYLFPKSDIKLTEKLKLVLCGTTNKFTDLAPSGYTNLSTMVGDGRNSYLLIDLDIRSRNGPSADAGFPLGEGWIPGGANSFKTGPYDLIDGPTLARREYIHFLSERAIPRPPLWFEEGVAMYFSTLGVSKNKITYARFGKDIVKWFNGPKMLPLGEFFALPAADYSKYNPNFSRQALVFVHYTMFARKMRHQKALLDFADKAAREPVTEALFRQYFGMSYNDMEVTMMNYASDGGFYKYVVAPKKVDFPQEPSYELRLMTDAECGRLKGEVLRLNKRFEDANAELLSPIQRKHFDTRLIASLGILQHSMGNFASARKHLEAAVAANVDDSAAYITLARLRLHESLKAAADQGSLSSDQMREILKPLFAARALNQPHPELYSLIADVWGYSRVPPTQDNLAVLDEGIEKFPRNSELVYKDAALKARYKFYDDAHTLIEIGLKYARDKNTEERFAQLKAGLPQAAEVTR